MSKFSAVHGDAERDSVKSNNEKFYKKLVELGKRKKVALTARMRKMMTILNAMVRENCDWQAN